MAPKKITRAEIVKIMKENATDAKVVAPSKNAGSETGSLGGRIPPRNDLDNMNARTSPRNSASASSAPFETGSLGGRIPPRNDLNNFVAANSSKRAPASNENYQASSSSYSGQNNQTGPGWLGRFWQRIKPKGNTRVNLPPLGRFYYEILILLAILAHLADAFWLSFSITPAAIGYRIMLYFILGIFVHLILNRGWGVYESIIEIVKVSAIPLFLVPLLSIILNLLTVGPEAVKIISTLTLAFPIWLFYIMYVRNEKIPLEGGFWNKVVNILFTPSGWARLWFFVLVILALFSMITFLGTMVSGGGPAGLLGGEVPGFGGIPGAENSGFDVQTSMDGLMLFLSTSTEKFTSSLKGFFKGMTTGFADLKNQTMGQYYTGQVEQNKEQTGVFITDFHVTGKQYDSVPIVAYGYIKARSFVEGITITPTCYAQSVTNKSRVYQGTTDPAELKNIYIEDQRGVICTFNDIFGESGALPADRYQLYLVLDFDFETWAYKQYYFIDRNYLVYLKTSDANPNTKLQIPEKTKTIYTNGPVMIGMDDAVEMPFAISSENTNYLPIGMTIDDKPQSYGVKGQVVKVYDYTLRLPTAFNIDYKNKRACTVDGKYIYSEPDNNVSGYTIYKFDIARSMPDYNLSGSYISLNCNAEIPKESVIDIIPGANTPAIVSVVGTANYAYRLTKQIPVTVEKTPGT